MSQEANSQQLHIVDTVTKLMLRLLCTDQSLQDMLTKLSTIAALIPVSTAECERAMNRIKTELRNRLKTSTLDCLM